MTDNRSTRKVLITGANGHLGFMLFEHFSSLPGWDVWGLDITPPRHPKIVQGDTTQFDADWTHVLDGCDAIVHLAADRSPTAEWASAIHNNMDAVFNLYEAAARHHVRRIVFASSNWVFGGYRFGDERLSESLTPKPVNAYGVSKLFGERVAAFYARARGVSTVSARIGWLQWTHDNVPGPHMAMGRWGQQMWLSQQDFFDGMRCAVEAQFDGLEIVNLVSNNDGMRWDLDAGRTKIGFTPSSHATPRLPLSLRLKDFGAWLRHKGVPDWLARRIPDSW
ncbi:NAD-dependent epimerase/dehydratase family protein [Pararobbsia silviterrae]|uniref:NAD(P)-dependent oxidoreductase n=1 Tax=Pararobbsia silviterrae TaxID=1792498 RepID=A0A494XSV5_9BURK|nr:NAD(P)-dependent oxidoreductase [Pararobbsia silviterrae]RKP53732.1 NAD(P)-dependent oxidoreductase [Pararobbsia silviterrae]